MAVFRITGGKKLQGDLYPQGAKNEALQVLSAVLLTKEPIVIKNIPKIRDVMNLIELLMSLGVKVTQLGTNDYKFQADDVNLDYSSKGLTVFAEAAQHSIDGVKQVGTHHRDFVNDQ